MNEKALEIVRLMKMPLVPYQKKRLKALSKDLTQEEKKYIKDQLTAVWNEN